MSVPPSAKEDRLAEATVLNFVWSHVLVSAAASLRQCESFCQALKEQVLPAMLEYTKHALFHELDISVGSLIGFSHVDHETEKMSEEMSLCLDCAFVMLVLSFPQHKASSTMFSSNQDLLARYPEFQFDREKDLISLRYFRNVMATALLLKVPLGDTSRLLSIAGRIVDGSDTALKRRRHDISNMKKRLLICHREGDFSLIRSFAAQSGVVMFVVDNQLKGLDEEEWGKENNDSNISD